VKKQKSEKEKITEFLIERTSEILKEMSNEKKEQESEKDSCIDDEEKELMLSLKF